MKAFKKLRAHTNRFLTHAVFLFSSRPKTSEKKTALYFKDDAIGDFLFGTAMITQLQAEYDQVIVVCVSAVRPIAELFLPPSHVDVIDKVRFDENLSYRVEHIEKWVKLNPQLVVMSSLRSSFVDQVASVFRTVFKKQLRIVSTDDPTPKKQKRAKLYSALSAHPPDTELDAKYLCGAHRKEHLLVELALDKKTDPAVTRPRLPKTKLRTQPGHRAYFCILPDTGDSRRTYRRDELLKLAAKTAETSGLEGIILSASKLGGEVKGLTDLTGVTSLVESLTLIAGAQFTLTNETGLGHASWMLARPTVMIMPGGNFAHFHATDPALKAVYDERPCFNCHHHCQFEFKERFPCIEEIPTSKIEAMLTQITRSIKNSAGATI